MRGCRVFFMISNDGYFKTDKGPQLYYRAWEPEQEANAVITIVHGGGEHSGRYLNVANYLVPRGYAVYAYDLRGHGKSPGKRGHVNRFAESLVKWIDLVRLEGKINLM